MYLQYWRAPPAHFSGWSAFALCAAVIAIAVALAMRLVETVAISRHLSKYLLAASALIAAFAIGLKLGPSSELQQHQWGFMGLLSDDALRNALSWRTSADFVSTHMAGVFTWLKVSCAGLIVAALLCKIFGVTKQTLSDHPAFAATLFIAFGSPFLAWVSLELIGYAFGQLALSDEGGAVWRARVSLALSMLLVLAGAWLFTAISMLVLVVRVFGVRVIWKSESEGGDRAHAF